MNILLTNDDSIYAEGLWALFRKLAEKNSVTVVAPDREQSAVGHGITLHHPLRANMVRVYGGHTGYAVTGTPADCIKLGIHEILGSKPDMVISGINPGSNVGSSVNYSGTAAAAREAALYGVAAIAVSVQCHKPNYYEDAAILTEILAKHLFEKGLPFGTFFNVNMPDLSLADLAGVRITRQDVTPLSEYFEKRTDPRNRPYYWLGSDIRSFDENSDTDGIALLQNYVSITPLKCDMTDYAVIEDIKKEIEDIAGTFGDHREDAAVSFELEKN